MAEFFLRSFANFQPTDIADIVIVSTLVYIVLIWFKETRAAFIFAGILILGIVYLLARRYELYLTVLIFQGFFAVLLVALVVIFQEELRHFFERIAVWGLTYRRFPSKVSPLIEILMRTVSEFSDAHIGALIVLAGRDPIDRHLEGGSRLDGAVSEPLLHSLFDPHSLGHDGAVLIHQGRVERFACHLPLSQNLAKTRRHGTRHAAALGLVERTDALCLVVSEESGKISVAKGGSLKTIDGVGRLGPILESFFRDRFPTERRTFWKTLLTKNFLEKAVATLIAVVLWLAFGQRAERVQHEYSIPIRYENLRKDLYIKRPYPDEAVVTLSAFKRSFDLFDPEGLQIRIDLNNSPAGDEVVPLLEDYLILPDTISVEDMNPPLIRLQVAELTAFTLKVEPELTGTLPDGLRIKTVKISPDRVSAYSYDNKDIRDLILKTEAIALDEITESQVIQTQVAVPLGIHPAQERFPDLKVTIGIEQKSGKDKTTQD